MQEYQTLINLGAGAALSIMGWFARQLWDAVTDLKKDLAKLREEIAKDYTPKNDFQMAMHELRGMFEIIRSKLEDKADK
jgi:hypothetical protein